jgi:hypothetical protein
VKARKAQDRPVAGAREAVQPLWRKLYRRTDHEGIHASDSELAAATLQGALEPLTLYEAAIAAFLLAAAPKGASTAGALQAVAQNLNTLPARYWFPLIGRPSWICLHNIWAASI